MSDLYKTLLISRPQVLSSGGSGLLVAANNLSDVADVTTARTNLGVASAIEQASNDSGRKKEGFLYSDGATSNRAQIQTPGVRGNLAGAPVASWVGWVDVPTNNPSIEHYVAYIAPTLSPINQGTDTGLVILGLANSTEWRIRQNAVTGASNWRWFTNATFRSTYSGQRIWLEVRFTKGTSNPVVRVNGVDVSASFIPSSNGSAPEWLDSGLVSTYLSTGYQWPTGTAPLGCWLNAHLTDAESETWRLTGRPPAWVALGGSTLSYYDGANAASKSTETNAITNLNASGTNAGSWASVAGARTGGSGSFYARWTSNNSGVGGSKFSLSPTGSIYNRIGQRVGVRFWARASQAITIPGCAIAENNSGATEFVSISIGTDWAEYVVFFSTPISRSIINSFRFNDFTFPSGATIDIDDMEWIQAGALSLPSVQSIGVVEDTTAIGGNQARLVGNIPIILDSVPVSVIELPAVSRTGSTEILGGAISGARKRRIVSVTGNSSASVNLSLGTTPSGTQLINAQAVNGDFDITTFASRILAAGSSLHLSFSSTTTASIHIHLTDL